MRAALFTVLILPLVALTSVRVQAQEPPVVAVTVTAKACEPNELTVKAGRVTFLITNKSSRALEWEILKGVMIVDERENIAPGFKQRLTTTLEAGEYEITCGLLSNPRGRLIVLNAEGGTQAGLAKPGAAELVGLMAEQRVWMIGELNLLAKAVAASDRAAARASAQRLSALKSFAPPQAGALDAALAAPQGDLSGPAAAYTEALRGAQMTPQILAKTLGEAARALAKAAPAEADTAAAGLAAQVALFVPLARRADPALAARFDDALARLRATPAEGAEALAAAIDGLSPALDLK